MATATSYTKAGVDAKAAPLATTAPLAPSETPTAGTSGSAARADHVHPVEKSARSQSANGSVSWWAPAGELLGSADTSTAWKAPGTPLPIHRVTTIARISSRGRAVDATTPGTIEIACYATNTDGLPVGAPVFVTPALAAASNNMEFVLTVPSTLNPGLYFLFAGPRGYGATKPSLCGLRAVGYASSFIPYDSSNPGSYQAVISLANFAAGTPGWPTLAGAMSDLEIVGQNAAGTWGYAVRGY